MFASDREIDEKTLAAECYDGIQDRIINGTFRPGQKLKTDELKTLFSVGQSPVREALSRLAESGLVIAEGNRGFRVAPVSEDDVRDVYRTFFQIEALALKQAIDLGDDAWEASVVAALHHLALVETKKEPVEYSVWAERNYAFHVALIAGCKSPVLLALRYDVYRRFDRYCRMAYTLIGNKLEGNHKEHKKLAEAVLARDTGRALDLMRHHLMDALDDVIALLKKHELI